MTTRYLDLLRHGEVMGGMRFRGRSDDPLTDLGWAQMSQSVADAPTWTSILSSPLKRCLDFAECFAETHALPLKRVDGLRERDFGDWEGRSTTDIDLDELTRFWQNPADFTPPGAETFSDFRARVISTWRRILRGADPHVMIITHGGVIRTILADVLEIPATSMLLIEVPHACRTRLRACDAPGRPSLVFHGGP